MSVSATTSMIQREIDHEICLLTFDRPESGANIFDAATLSDLDEQLDFIEEEDSLKGIVILSAKKSIFIAGADLKTLLHQAQTGAGRIHRGGATNFQSAGRTKNSDLRCNS